MLTISTSLSAFLPVKMVAIEFKVKPGLKTMGKDLHDR